MEEWLSYHKPRSLSKTPIQYLSWSRLLGQLIDYAPIVWEIGDPPSLALALHNFGWPGISSCSHIILLFPLLCPLHQPYNTAPRFPMAIVCRNTLCIQTYPSETTLPYLLSLRNESSLVSLPFAQPTATRRLFRSLTSIIYLDYNPPHQIDPLLSKSPFLTLLYVWISSLFSLASDRLTNCLIDELHINCSLWYMKT